MHTVKYKNGTIVSKSNDQKENAANNGMMQVASGNQPGI